MSVVPSTEEINAIVYADHGNPFSVLGMHADGPDGALVVRAFLPDADAVEVIDADTNQPVASLERLHSKGFFAAVMGQRNKRFVYRLKVVTETGEHDLEDPYRFPALLGELDIHLLSEGTHRRAYQRMGAQFVESEGVAGVAFRVWAPNARRVAVVGDFNAWDSRRHPMRLYIGIGVWEIFIPGIQEGMRYKYHIKAADGKIQPLKADPYGFAAEHPPNTASLVGRSYWNEWPDQWSDQAWMETRAGRNERTAPISIYEVHLGSWKRVTDDNNRYLSYRELAEELIPYVQGMGFTHIELMPVNEYPFDGSWGYQPIGLFAPTSRFGSPADFRYFIDCCHRAGIGVLLDWVPGHFPSDIHGLGYFDGTHLYEHADPRQGYQQDWNTLVYNFGRKEVANYLLSNALFWLDRYRLDGLRVDAVASMLYLDYSRREGEWIPNRFGGRENLEAIAMLRSMNELSYAEYPGIMTVAEESTAWPGVSRPVHLGGLGFGYKWNMGWMNDTLSYMGMDPIHRRFHHHQMTFASMYAYSENFVLPLSHDEVVHGKGSLLGRMPGDTWRQFANLRAYFGFMWTHPGKKLLFMGGEFAQGREWDHDAGLAWWQLDIQWHAGVQRLVRDLNHLYRELPALHQYDCSPEGFSWIEADDAEFSVYAFIRSGAPGVAPALVVCNFTPVPRLGYRLGVPDEGFWAERLNTDAEVYGGSGMGNLGGVRSQASPSHGRANSITVNAPPLATVIFQLSAEE